MLLARTNIPIPANIQNDLNAGKICIEKENQRKLQANEKEKNEKKILKNGNFSGSHRVALSSTVQFQVELEFGNFGFCGGRKTGVLREKPLVQGQEKPTNLTHI